ncbi:YqaA family protein [Marinospirillum alkaliphilum]|uniref:Membrane protein YqaA, SNARE-associated domain n=1 Tax=Marinospirillum alkaliphilum DSM 21637 TaxID=1122209 RepID=A0A1K1Y430_9GAMM|nr:YqaA family protein [Marinospirillum alkaliphilum]SFX56746.1 membrane protein YqaA, SNARE-associated domain [Marinospirillum alkaliphilum DSM 21637]
MSEAFSGEQGLLWVFLVGFLSATLLPGGSEALVVAQSCSGQVLWALWLTASVSNTLGSFVNWGMGRWLLHYETRRWFPVKPHQRLKAERWFARWGKWSLFLAWLPVVGDPLTLVAGVLRVHWLTFLLLVGAGKALRYAVVLGLAGLAGC